MTLVEALQFYADPKNYLDTPSWDGTPECITEKAVPIIREEGMDICDCGDIARKALKEYAETSLVYPEELTEQLKDILSMMMWSTAPIAATLRAGGAKIPHKAELEQAHVLHWLTVLALKHPLTWREVAVEKLEEVKVAGNAQ